MNLPPPQPMMSSGGPAAGAGPADIAGHAGPAAGAGSATRARSGFGANPDPDLVLVAPPAPGSLGVPVDPAAAQSYLWALREWVAQRRSDLAAVDAAVLKLPRAEQASITTDLTVALTFWKAISDRFVLLETTFDGGRVGAKEAERLSTLIHGRLDSTTAESLSLPSSGTLAVTLPEACRLLDSLSRTLLARASLMPGAAESSHRITMVRASVERTRDQLPLVPAGSEQTAAEDRLSQLDRRVGELIERARRGADIGGLIGPVEIDVAILERDLIVAAAERAETAKGRVRTTQHVAELKARAEAITALEVTCVAAISPAPRLAIPNVSALGPVPQSAADLADYDGKLERVSRALDLAHETYAGALAERDEIIGLVGAFGSMLAGVELPPAAEADLTDLRARLDEVLASPPILILRARALAAAHQSYVDTLTRALRGARKATR